MPRKYQTVEKIAEFLSVDASYLSGESDNEMQSLWKQHFKDSHINSQSDTPDMPKIYPNHIAGAGSGHSFNRFNFLIFNGF